MFENGRLAWLAARTHRQGVRSGTSRSLAERDSSEDARLSWGIPGGRAVRVRSGLGALGPRGSPVRRENQQEDVMGAQNGVSAFGFSVFRFPWLAAMKHGNRPSLSCLLGGGGRHSDPSLGLRCQRERRSTPRAPLEFRRRLRLDEFGDNEGSPKDGEEGEGGTWHRIAIKPSLFFSAHVE